MAITVNYTENLKCLTGSWTSTTNTDQTMTIIGVVVNAFFSQNTNAALVPTTWTTSAGVTTITVHCTADSVTAGTFQIFYLPE